MVAPTPGRLVKSARRERWESIRKRAERARFIACANNYGEPAGGNRRCPGQCTLAGTARNIARPGIAAAGGSRCAPGIPPGCRRPSVFPAAIRWRMDKCAGSWRESSAGCRADPRGQAAVPGIYRRPAAALRLPARRPMPPAPARTRLTDGKTPRRNPAGMPGSGMLAPRK